MYAVTGVTGNTGSEVARALLERGKKVRVLVRSAEKGREWAERGAEVREVDLADPRSVADALYGAAAAYLLNPPDLSAVDFLGAQQRLTDAIAEGVEASGVGHLVFLSSVGAHLPGGTGPIRSASYAETRLRGAAAGVTFLRPAYFVTNWAPMIEQAVATGVLPSVLPEDLAIPMVTARDIGHAAADALLDPTAGVRVIELAGREDRSPKDVAGVLAEQLGRSVQVQPIPLAAVGPMVIAALGASESAARLYTEMVSAMVGGGLTFQGAGHRLVRGEEPFEEAVGRLISVAA